MKKLLFLLMSLIIAISGMAQNYFEKIIPSEDGVIRHGKFVVETHNNGFIVAATTILYHHQNDFLLSIDKNGEITKSLVMQIDGKNLKYCGVFKHPEHNNEYLAIAVLTDNNYNNYIQNTIAFLRIDENLNILGQDTWYLGDEYTQLACFQYTDFPLFILNDDGTLEMAAHFRRSDTSYGYLFAQLTPYGKPVEIHEDYTLHHNGNWLLEFFVRNKTEKSYGVIIHDDPENSYDAGEYYYCLDSVFNFTKNKFITSLYLRTVPENSQFPDSTYIYAGNNHGSAEYYNDTLFLVTNQGAYFTGSQIHEMNFIAILNDSLDVKDVKFWDVDHIKSNSAQTKAISVKDNYIYHCGINGLKREHNINSLKDETTIVISKFDNDLRLKWRRYYNSPGQSYDIQSIKATEDGGCIIVGVNASIETWNIPNIYILKVDENGYDAIEENEESLAKPYFCYPNPAKDIVYIELSPDVNCQSVEIYTLDGRLVKTCHGASQQTTINVEDLNSGVYVMKLRMVNGKEFSERIVKE